MIYPGTEDGMSVGQGNGGGDAKRRLIAMMSKKSGALPLFGGQGRSANDLPSVGAPAIGFNPFLKMLAGRPNESFGIQGNADIQNGPGPVQGGGAMGDPNNQGFQGSSIPLQGTSGVTSPAVGTSPNPTDPSSWGGAEYSGGHYNQDYVPPGTQAPQLTGNQYAPTAYGAGQNSFTMGDGSGISTNLSGMDPATQIFLLHLAGGLGYNQDR